MTDSAHDRLAELFWMVRSADAAERDDLIQNVCGDDASLRENLEALLELDDRESGLDAPAHLALGSQSDEPLPGTEIPVGLDRVGPFRILGFLGEGATGVVYRAEQEQPRRVVALKVLKTGLTSPDLLRRFEQESEILGRLQHPGIAAIHAAGTAPGEHGPTTYFAMELVEGASLTTHATAEKLDPSSRLELLARVCNAVHHAHQRGVIHRDLKPANILVEASGQPKVLDFGIARTTNADLQATTLLTRPGSVLGTLPYMSPEQVRGDPLALDTRTDVYSLGVIGYELLTGQLPIPVEGLTVPEAIRTLTEQDPKRLGTSVASLRGDVETIIDKALSRDPERRYSSAAELAADIGRHLRNEPITARPTTLVYQLSRFARRNRLLVRAAMAVVAALVLGLVGTAWQAHSAARLAERRKRTLDFLYEKVLVVPDPWRGGDKEVPLAAVLENAVEAAEKDFGDEPEILAEILGHVATTLLRLQRFDSAESLQRRVVELRDATLGSHHTLTLTARNSLAMVLRAMDRLAEAESVTRRTLELGREDDRAYLVALTNLALLQREQGHEAEVVATYRRVLPLQEARLGRDHRDTVRTRSNLARLLQEQGKIPEAIVLMREVRNSHERTLSAEHPDRLITLDLLGGLLADGGELDEGIRLTEEALAGLLRTLGPEDDTALGTEYRLCRLLLRSTRTGETIRRLRSVLERIERLHGAEHRHSVLVRSLLTEALLENGELDEAETSCQAASSVAERVLVADHPIRLGIEWLRGRLRLAQGNPAEALVVLQAIHPTAVRVYGQDPRLARIELTLGRCHLLLDDLAAAERLLVRAHRILQDAYGPERPEARRARNALIDTHERSGRPEAAAELRE